MTTSTLIFAFLFLLALLAAGGLRLVHRQRLRAGSTLDLHDALRCCDCLLRLLSNLQQHRGLSSGWLAGDKSFEVRMMGKRAEIEALFAELSPFVACESERTRPCLTSNDLALLRFKWRTLSDELARGSVEQNIAQHGALIAQVLDWLAAFGEARIELAGGGRVQPELVRNYSHRLPALAECLGQARAIGSSVAARHACPAVARVRLIFLIERSESLLEQASAADDPGPVGGRAKTAVGLMAQTVRSEMLAAAGVTLSADEYFSLSTRAVDATLEWARECGACIDRDLCADAAPQPGSRAAAWGG
ncbi:MAG: nitrate- and nitrite sensing domain-containing protein [Rhodocyclaceae bacterium]